MPSREPERGGRKEKRQKDGAASGSPKEAKQSMQAGGSYRLHALLMDLANEITMAWQTLAQPIRLDEVLAQRPRRLAALADERTGLDFSREAHAVEHILVARGREDLVDPVEFVMEPGRLMAPEQQQVLKAVRDGFR